MAILRCCYHTMFFSLDILRLWDMVSIRRLVQVPPSSSPYQAFTRFVCCFTINISWNFFCSDQIIAKIKHFQSKTNFFFQLMAGRFWFCCFYGVFFFFLFIYAIMKLWINNISVAWLAIWPLITSCDTSWFQTKLEIDTTSITLGNVKEELFR